MTVTTLVGDVGPREQRLCLPEPPHGNGSTEIEIMFTISRPPEYDGLKTKV